MENNEKDVLYYSDMIYWIKKHAGFEQEHDEETEARVEKRAAVIDADKLCFQISEFSTEFYDCVLRIFHETGDIELTKNTHNISRHPELVTKLIKEYEEKRDNAIKREEKKAEIINTLAMERSILSISANQVAEAIGVSHTTIERIEHFKMNPSLDMIIKYADYLGYELSLEKKRTNDKDMNNIDVSTPQENQPIVRKRTTNNNETK